MQSEVLRVDVNVDIHKNSTQNVGVTLMSQDINNYSFYLRVLQDGELLVMDETYEVEVLSVFTTSKSRLLTKGTIKSQYVDWVFDPSYISKSEVVKNYVYVRKNGVLLVSADANCFIFSVGLSAIDSDVGRVAEVYDENYEKVLLDYSGALDSRTTERLDLAVDDFNQRGDVEIADWRDDADVELEDYLSDRVVIKNLIENGDFSNGVSKWNGTTITTRNGKGVVLSTSQYGGSSNTVIPHVSRVGHKIYASAKAKFDSERVYFIIHHGIGQGFATSSKLGEEELVSLIQDIPAGATSLSIRVQDSRPSDWTESIFDDVMMIDLTQTFGAGNEPSKEWMDRLVEQTGYFDEHILNENWQIGEVIRLNNTKADRVVLKNLVDNGNFKLDQNSDLIPDPFGYTSLSAVSLINGVARVKSLGSSRQVIWQHKTITDFIAGNKLYVRYYFQSHTSDNFIPSFRLGNDYFDKTGEVWDNAKKIAYTNIVEVPSGLSNPVSLAIGTFGLATDAEVSFQNFTVIDLTQTFGAGNEPSKEMMDRLIEKTGYFDEHILDGNWQVGEISRLEDSKADKLQAAWITPTLLNGWEQHSNYDEVGYYKDDFGVVHLRGSIRYGTGKSNIFTLPVGYRPSKYAFYPVLTTPTGTITGSIVVDLTGVVYSYQTGDNMALNHISFRAER